jgi:hypothetical protein
MDFQYSRITGVFYPSSIDYGSSIPADAIDVSKADFDAAMSRPLGHTFDFVNGKLIITAPAGPTLDELKSAKLVELSAAFAQAMLSVKAGYPADEIQSWFDQKTEAVAYAANASAATPLLSAMASARGITVADLAARVIANAMQYAANAGLLIGKRQKYEDAVNAAIDAADVAAVFWVD